MPAYPTLFSDWDQGFPSNPTDALLPSSSYEMDTDQLLALLQSPVSSTSNQFSPNSFQTSSISPNSSSSQQSTPDNLQFLPAFANDDTLMAYILELQPQGVSTSANKTVSQPSFILQDSAPNFLEESFPAVPSASGLSSSASPSTSSPLYPPTPASRPASARSRKPRSRPEITDAALERLREKNRGYQAKRRQKLNTTIEDLESKLVERDETILTLREEVSRLKGMLAGMEHAMKGGRSGAK